MLYMICAPLHVDIRNTEEVHFASWLLSGLYLSLHTSLRGLIFEVNASWDTVTGKSNLLWVHFERVWLSREWVNVL